MIGRSILGIGGESLSVLYNVAIAQWFFMQEFALAYGILVTVGRSGTVFNNFLTPILAKKEVGYASLVGLMFLIMSAA